MHMRFFVVFPTRREPVTLSINLTAVSNYSLKNIVLDDGSQASNVHANPTEYPRHYYLRLWFERLIVHVPQDHNLIMKVVIVN